LEKKPDSAMVPMDIGQPIGKWRWPISMRAAYRFKDPLLSGSAHTISMRIPCRLPACLFNTLACTEARNTMAYNRANYNDNDE